jgi:lysine 2,3-aminomutase
MTHQDHRMQNTTATTLAVLVSEGLIDSADVDALKEVAEKYAIAAPRHLIDLIDQSATNDPIAMQIIPSEAELKTSPDERPDPIGDHTFSPVKGLVHRYPDRVLLKVHSACAVYCRFCFRREMVGPSGDAMDETDITAALAYIGDRPNISEVILTGGDPLVLSPQRLTKLLDALDQVDHVQVVRFHTRLPVAAPDRITNELVNVLSKPRATVYVAVHSNQARELSDDAVAACNRLARAGIPLVGQTVLLKGVNDTADSLAALFRAMVRARITPYYLHHPDLAPGTNHFRVPIEAGQALMKHLRGQVSGLALPTYMLDIPGGYGKVPIGPSYLKTTDHGLTLVEDVNGETHRYPPSEDDPA